MRKFLKAKLPLIIIIFILAVSSTLLALADQHFLVTQEKIKNLGAEVADLKNQDQLKVNAELRQEAENINHAFQKAALVYEEILDFRDKGGKNPKIDEAWAQIISLLAKKDYLTAETNLASLSAQLKIETDKLGASVKIPENVPVNNAPPNSGYRRQQVTTDNGNFLVSLVAADLGSTKIMVDTASDATCANNCPVLPLADYVARNGAFAGVNGTYFCPAEYPQCAGKTNSFDTLLMNKNKVYFNDANNVYSTVPAVIFGNGWIRFVEKSLDWGRDTSVDSVIANRPLLLMGGQIKFSGEGEVKEGNKGSRSFVGNRGNTIYIGVVHSAAVAEAAIVLQKLGLENALNLDDGGSTALWSGGPASSVGGYKVGPGRNLPNVVLFVRK